LSKPLYGSITYPHGEYSVKENERGKAPFPRPVPENSFKKYNVEGEKNGKNDYIL
jgi:hypothetical protein